MFTNLMAHFRKVASRVVLISKVWASLDAYSLALFASTQILYPSTERVELPHRRWNRTRKSSEESLHRWLVHNRTGEYQRTLPTPPESPLPRSACIRASLPYRPHLLEVFRPRGRRGFRLLGELAAAGWRSVRPVADAAGERLRTRSSSLCTAAASVASHLSSTTSVLISSSVSLAVLRGDLGIECLLRVLHLACSPRLPVRAERGTRPAPCARPRRPCRP